ncbi:hypothetical protein ACROYT_G000446 [Oculina patagonica]
MPPRARRSTSRPSTQMYIDPAAFGALSIADLRSLCVRNGIQSTGVRKTLERRLRELNSPPPTRQNISEHESTALNIDATAAQRQERPEFTDDQMQTIQQLIADTVKQSAREIATEAARAAVNASSSLLAQRPASLVPDTAPETAVHPSTTPVSFASPFQEIPGQYIKDIQSDMSATDAVDRIHGLTALPTLCGNQSGKGGGIEMVTMETQRRVPPIESENTTCPLPTPINVKRLQETLTNHPDQEFVSQLCNNLRYGADVGFTGRRVARFSRNLPTALSQPNIVSENLSREVALGRVAGPFPTPPLPNFQVSPIGLVPKKHSTKFRTIFHLSFPKSGETSINSSIPKEDFSLQYITIDNAIQGILSLGQGCFLAKTDFESAFRLIPLRPSDYELFGMYWEGSYYYDKVLPFGLRSAPYLFNLLSNAIEWILLNHCLVSFVCHILDDFLIIEPASFSPPLNLLCQQSLNSMLLTFSNLGIPIAANKTEGPSTTLEFMGIILDTVRMEARLPADKVERIQASLVLFQTKRTCTLKELQSLIGTLNFACRVIPQGDPFYSVWLS